VNAATVIVDGTATPLVNVDAAGCQASAAEESEAEAALTTEGVVVAVASIPVDEANAATASVATAGCGADGATVTAVSVALAALYAAVNPVVSAVLASRTVTKLPPCDPWVRNWKLVPRRRRVPVDERHVHRAVERGRAGHH
jgi:hypothetical protein